MCNCRKNRAAKGATYTVTYPNGATETKSSEVAAKLAAGKVPGATWKASTPATTS